MTPDDRVADLLGEWYARGETEDPDDVIRAHPELAEALTAGFAARELRGCARAPAPAPAPPAAGARTIGDFRIVREIGRGGMGIVYEAEQTSMGRRVALKILDPAITFSTKAVERFRREARAAGRLHHTNIVPVFAMGEHDGVWYYAMEWVRGTTLAQVIEGLRRREGVQDPPAGGGAGHDVPAGSPVVSSPMPDPSGLTVSEGGRAWFARVATTCAGVADALGVAHAAGVVHRDVKPANLVFDAAGTLKIMDFGLAHVEGEASRTVTGDLLGTPAYMSPEQASGGGASVDGRSDVYALGATLYELLTLRAPFHGEDPRETCAHILTKEPTRPRRLRPGIPRDLETIVLKAMEKDPGRRYRTADAMAADLRAFAEGRAIDARPVGQVGRMWRGVKRHRALSALGAVVALLVAAVGVLAFQASEEAAFRRRLELDRPGPPPGDGLGAAAEQGARRRRLAEEEYAAAGDPAKRAVGPAWVRLKQIPVGSYGLGAAFVGGRLYAISGFFTSRVAVYDPAGDAWRDVAPLPRPLQYFGTAVMDGKIYVVGGDHGGSGASAELHAYEPATDTWVTRASMPGGARWDVGVAVLDGKLWVLGGVDGPTSLKSARVESYDPVTDRWTPRSPMRSPRGLAGGACALGGRLYAAGGSTASGVVATLEVYDPATDAWASRAPLPRAVATQAVVVKGRLFMVGGGVGDGAMAVFAYDPAADTWTSEPPMLWDRRAHGVAYDPVGHRLYAVAGYIDSWLSSFEVCSPRHGVR